MVFEDLYQAARRVSAAIDRSARGRIVVSGADRATYLQGLLTNDIAALQPGGGCYSAYLTPQGRMIADMFLYELGDLLLVSLPLAVKDAVLARFDQFLFTEDVKLGDVTDGFVQIAIVGPEAARVVAGIVDDLPVERLAVLKEHGNIRGRFEGQPAIVTRVTDTGEPGFDLYVERQQAAALESRLLALGVAPLNAEAAEALRIEAGIPRFGPDMDDETIPLEAGIESRAISMTKGCYVGQEVIVRVLHRGHGRVARKLGGLVLDGDVAPRPGAPVREVIPANPANPEKEIGRVTSSTVSPALGRPIALAYLHRDHLGTGTIVSVEGVRAVVTDLPFVRQTND